MNNDTYLGVIRYRIEHKGDFYEQFHTISPDTVNKVLTHIYGFEFTGKANIKHTLDIAAQTILEEYFKSSQYLDCKGRFLIFNAGGEPFKKCQSNVRALQHLGLKPVFELTPQGLREHQLHNAKNITGKQATYLGNFLDRYFSHFEKKSYE